MRYTRENFKREEMRLPNATGLVARVLLPHCGGYIFDVCYIINVLVNLCIYMWVDTLGGTHAGIMLVMHSLGNQRQANRL